MSKTLPPPNYRAMADFRYRLRKFLRFSKEYLADAAKLTPEQFEVLLALKAFSSADGMLVGQLSERLQVKHHTAVSLTDKLVARKLATKKRDDGDRRQVYVKLTARGATLVHDLASVHHDEMRRRSGDIIEALTRMKNS